MSEEDDRSDTNKRDDPATREDAAEKAAAVYAWEYFKYHASQRQAVFRFYLTLVGATTIAFAYSLRADGAPPLSPTGTPPLASGRLHLAIGIIFIFVSFLFWRLDERSRRLIKFSEAALKVREEKLGGILKDESVKLMVQGDVMKDNYPLSDFETFRQIYSTIFLTVAIMGAFILHWIVGTIAAAGALVWYLRRKRLKSAGRAV